MKLSQLLEAPPVFINKEMPIITGATIEFYSIDTLNRDFEVLYKDKIDNTEVFVFLAKDKSKAVIGVLGNRREDNKLGIFIKCTAEFKDKPDISYDRLIKMPEHIFQIDSVEANRLDKNKGYGFMLYLALIKAGYVVFSDYNQYSGGKALWKKLVSLMKAHNYSIYIIDNGHPVLDDKGEPLVYDGNNIDDADIWSTSPDTTKYHVLLMAKKNQ